MDCQTTTQEIQNIRVGQDYKVQERASSGGTDGLQRNRGSSKSHGPSRSERRAILEDENRALRKARAEIQAQTVEIQARAAIAMEEGRRLTGQLQQLMGRSELQSLMQQLELQGREDTHPEQLAQLGFTATCQQTPTLERPTIQSTPVYRSARPYSGWSGHSETEPTDSLVSPCGNSLSLSLQVPPELDKSIPDSATPLEERDGSQDCDDTQSGDQVVPLITDTTSLPSSPVSGLRQSDAIHTPATNIDPNVPMQAHQHTSSAHDEAQDHHMLLVDESEQLKVIIQQKDAALAESTFHLQQHSFLLAQKDAELGRTRFQLDQARAASNRYQRDQMTDQHCHQQQMAEMHHVVNRDRQQFDQHLHRLQDQVNFLQTELHTVSSDKMALQAEFRQQQRLLIQHQADQVTPLHSETPDLDKVRELQRQTQSLEVELKQAEKKRYVQSQKYRFQLREHRDAHETKTRAL